MGVGESKLRAVDDNYFLLLNLPMAATVKRGTEISITLDNGKRIQLKSNNDVISLNDADISKKMMVFDLDPENEMKELLK